MGRSSQPDPRRRSILQFAAAGVVLIPLVNLAGCSPADDPAPEPGPVTEPSAERPPPPEQAPAPSAAPPPQAPADATQEPVYLDEDAPDAQALAYTHDATTVDAAAHPRYAPGQVCANCSLYLGDQVAGETAEPVGEVAGWGGCTIFPGRLVNAAGWCSAWVPRA